MSAATLAALRRFASSDVDVARCDLCAGAIGPDHEHLLDPTTRQLQCACLVCGRILGTSATASWKLVRRRVERLPACDIPDETWAELRLPIDLAFFVRTGNDVVARYPSPAGLVE